ncbi:TonB-dependent receptor [Cecembia lonarensis]|uniref:Vitamin B12/cobalamin outer membrane transporter n=1 Tax=Cecembia lonarensis (strain CCUG 58316 / KCTC 22772 / LW9) TaxID=1225176 RepID=K1LFD5_CECL9|nr:TonB-dependent receptor plug domain-containing protein [Cecembia lonarensis]EKB49043.1 vitamin B12/cobalamin outer membrane transporter [Cecembia lonarensis LW9]
MVWLFYLVLGFNSLDSQAAFSEKAVSRFLASSVLLDEQAIGDTVGLEVVEVFSPSLDKYTYGQQVKTINQEDLRDFQGLGLSELLQQRTGLFLRQYGPGMLASLAIRGTSAGHNAVFWNGLPINSPSLGQTDFSILPVGAFDEVQLHFGSGGALYGTDAIGGAVHLNSKLKFGRGHSLQTDSNFGSFGRWNQELQYTFSNDKISLRTRAYRNIAENDFPFRNLSRPGTPLERQEHAAFQQEGFSQDLAFQIKPNQLISSSFWYNQTERQIQPVMGSNTQDLQEDRNLRWVLDYFNFKENKTWNFKTGLVKDQLNFNASENSTSQFFLIGDLDWSISPVISSKSGIRYTHVQGRLSSYAAEENRIELYQNTNLHLREDLNVSINLRQFIYDGTFAPFTPSLGAEWKIFSQSKNELKLQVNGARSFKIPTLNDRFWEPGGNRDLLPESSWSAELGFSHLFRMENLQVNQQLTHYRMWVDNWIIWLPRGNFWSPENIREVHNKGLEYTLDAIYKMGSWGLEIQGNYNWVRAINQTNTSENDRSIGMQLPYTPIHKFQSLLGVSRGLFQSYINYHFTGSRFVTTDNISQLPDYALWDWGLRMGEWELGAIQGRLGFQINNVFNTSYEVLRLRAMPGRNYQLNIQIRL